MSELGFAPRLVLLHGFTGGPESWNGVLSHLVGPWSRARTLAPHLIGHGEHFAQPPDQLGGNLGDASFEAEVDRLAVMCRDYTAPAEQTVLVGYSLGARLGLGLVVKYPNLVQRAILVGVNPGLESAEERRLRHEQDEQLAQFAEQAGLQAFLKRWEALPLFDTQTSLPESAREEQRLIRRRNTAAGLAHSLRTCGLSQMPNYLPDLPHLPLPLCLVAGQRDERFVELARRMSAVLPQSSVHLIPGCGHNVLLEAPAVLAALIQTRP